MSKKLTVFGQFTRKLRVDHDELLKDMAERIDVTPAYLSAVELGDRNVPYDWVGRIIDSYKLTIEQVQVLTRAVSHSRVYDRLDIRHLSIDDKRLMSVISSRLTSLTQEQRETLADWVDFE